MHPYPSGLLNLLGAWAITTSIVVLCLVAVMVILALMDSGKKGD